MNQRKTRLVAFLLCCFLLLPSLAGCAQLEAYRLFFTGSGAKDPADGTVTPPSPEDTTRVWTIGYDESYTIKGHFLSLENVSTNDLSLLDIDEMRGGEGQFFLRSVGVGTGVLVYEQEGKTHRLPIVVQPAKLAVFFLFGEADARGTREPDRDLLYAADGYVYYTFPEYIERFTPETVDDYVVEWLRENEVSKNYSSLLCKTNELTNAGKGRYGGLCAPLAYKWTEQTGEHVWIINLAEEGTSIEDLLPSAEPMYGKVNDYDNLCALFSSVADTLTREYDAGHYTHARTGWFLAQGERDINMSAENYLASLKELTAAMDEALTFVYEGAGAAPVTYSPTFGGLIGCRATRVSGREMAAISGPRAAQLYAAGAKEELSSVYLLTDMASAWYSDTAVRNYFLQYDRHKFMIYYGYELPAAMSDLILPNGAYTGKALNEQAACAVENLLYLCGIRLQPAIEGKVTLLSYNGIDPIENEILLSYGTDMIAVAPSVTPLWRAKALSPVVRMEVEGREKPLDLYRIRGLTKGDLVLLTWSIANGERFSGSLPVKKISQFAFLDYLPRVQRDPEKDTYSMQGYAPFYTCGYVEQGSGVYIPYPSVDARNGWLYDGRSIWSGHGGVYAAHDYVFGPLDHWDSAYAFTAPESGTASLHFSSLIPGKGDYLFSICLNGKPVWPQAGGNTAGRDCFYTVRTGTTLEEMNEAVASLSISLRQGDVLLFLCRRISPGQTAEGALHPVVTIS